MALISALGAGLIVIFFKADSARIPLLNFNCGFPVKNRPDVPCILALPRSSKLINFNGS